MKLIESKAEYIPQEEGLEGIYKQIELAGRTAYHSLDIITPDSAKDFVDRMIKSKHGAALEHGTVYLRTDMHDFLAYSIWDKYRENPYSKSAQIQLDMRKPDEGFVCATTNYRVLQENGWLDDLQYLCSPTEFHEKRYTMRFTCSRAIANELVRHRVFSFLQESTRYINYSKERHGGEITCIKPSWSNCIETGNFFVRHDYKAGTYSSNFGYVGFTQAYLTSLCEAENTYFEMLNKGCTPQQARDVLPNATKTELIMTGFSSDWRFLMDLRLFGKTGAPHPDMVDLMQKAQKAMQEAGIWEDIMSKPSKFD